VNEPGVGANVFDAGNTFVGNTYRGGECSGKYWEWDDLALSFSQWQAEGLDPSPSSCE
jgi:hypothetical protein